MPIFLNFALVFFMKSTDKENLLKNPLLNILLSPTTKIETKPIWFARKGTLSTDLEPLTKEQRSWIHSYAMAGCAREYYSIA